jgi:hypothetical protein
MSATIAPAMLSLSARSNEREMTVAEQVRSNGIEALRDAIRARQNLTSAERQAAQEARVVSHAEAAAARLRALPAAE